MYAFRITTIMLNRMYIQIMKNILYVYFGIFVIFKNILCVCIDIRVVYLYIWLIETRYTNFKTNIYRIYVMNNQKIEHQSVIVFTSESKDSLVKNGGSRAWRAVLSKLEQAEYLICTQNTNKLHEHDPEIDHGQAFYIGKVRNIEIVEDDRKFIQVSEYAFLPNDVVFKEAWKRLTQGESNQAQQYPVAYKDTNELFEMLHLNLDELDWITVDQTQRINLNEPKTITSVNLPELIEEARQKISEAANVSPDKVTIQISF